MYLVKVSRRLILVRRQLGYYFSTLLQRVPRGSRASSFYNLSFRPMGLLPLTYHVNDNIRRIDDFIKFIPYSLAKVTLTLNKRDLGLQITFVLWKRWPLSQLRAFLPQVPLHLLVLRSPKFR